MPHSKMTPVIIEYKVSFKCNGTCNDKVKPTKHYRWGSFYTTLPSSAKIEDFFTLKNKALNVVYSKIRAYIKESNPGCNIESVGLVINPQ